jgi:hypothetical protein
MFRNVDPEQRVLLLLTAWHSASVIHMTLHGDQSAYIERQEKELSDLCVRHGIAVTKESETVPMYDAGLLKEYAKRKFEAVKDAEALFEDCMNLQDKRSPISATLKELSLRDVVIDGDSARGVLVDSRLGDKVPVVFARRGLRWYVSVVP